MIRKMERWQVYSGRGKGDKYRERRGKDKITVFHLKK